MVTLVIKLSTKILNFWPRGQESMPLGGFNAAAIKIENVFNLRKCLLPPLQSEITEYMFIMLMKPFNLIVKFITPG